MMAFTLLQIWDGFNAPLAETDFVYPVSGFNQLLAL